MADEMIPFEVARNNQRHNAGAVWYSPKASSQSGDGLGYASERVWRAPFLPVHEPKFQFPLDSLFFASGSCFARGLEGALRVRNLGVLSWSDEFARQLGPTEIGSPAGFTNKYNTAAILNEFRWALEGGGFPAEALAEIGPESVFDGHVTPVFPLTGREQTLKRHGLLSDVTAHVAAADVVVLTLGLTEVWFDQDTGLCLNAAPHPKAAAKYPGRFQFRLLNYFENHDNLEAICDLLKRYGKAEQKIVVTVSPVPLAATFTGQDVVVANTYSKSLLRVVAQDFAARHRHVDYFPSYEIVMNSDRPTSWAEDKRHVRGVIANQIMDFFLRSYVHGRAALPESTLGDTYAELD